jgi:hypothetical protein
MRALAILLACGLLAQASAQSPPPCFQVGTSPITIGGQGICLGAGTTPVTGPAFMDSAGNVWSITAGAQVAVNGVTDMTTSAVVKLAYVVSTTGVPSIVQKNSAGAYWAKSTPSGIWVGTPAPF